MQPYQKVNSFLYCAMIVVNFLFLSRISTQSSFPFKTFQSCFFTYYLLSFSSLLLTVSNRCLLVSFLKSLFSLSQNRTRSSYRYRYCLDFQNFTDVQKITTKIIFCSRESSHLLLLKQDIVQISGGRGNNTGNHAQKSIAVNA